MGVLRVDKEAIKCTQSYTKFSQSCTKEEGSGALCGRACFPDAKCNKYFSLCNFVETLCNSVCT